MPLSRRQLLSASVSALLAPRSVLCAQPKFTAEPFTLGVASGWPRPDGFSLWTRLAPQPLQEDGGMLPEPVDVVVEVARDDAFRSIVSTTRLRALFELAHSLHIDIRGLSPGSWYFYRFLSGDAASPTGRARTAEAPGSALQRLKFAIGSCQHYERGWYTAHRHLLDEQLDLMIFLGDYIYEASWGMDGAVRRYTTPEAFTLGEYRVRHAQHKADPHLQRLHAQVPWLFSWDDHEVDNDWAADRGESLDPSFLTRRAAAAQAYFEHMPVPLDRAPTAAGMRLYERFAFGDLARFHVLDDRLYRSYHACPSPVAGAGSTLVDPARCPELVDPSRTLLGAEQERWLHEGLKDSSARWSFIAQQTLVAPQKMHKDDSDPIYRWTDGWDGYPEARKRLLSSIRKQKTKNPVLLGGDMHCTYAADLHLDPEDPRSEVVAAEICGTSLTSDGSTEEQSRKVAADNPQLAFVDGWHRGYLTFDLTHERCAISLRSAETSRKDGAVKTEASFLVEDGRPGVTRA